MANQTEQKRILLKKGKHRNEFIIERISETNGGPPVPDAKEKWILYPCGWTKVWTIKILNLKHLLEIVEQVKIKGDEDRGLTIYEINKSDLLFKLGFRHIIRLCDEFDF